jgi:hypothetical protein
MSETRDSRDAGDTGAGLPRASDSVPVAYDRPPSHAGMIAEKDVLVPMRDGVNLCVDIYRPDTTEKLPVLLAFAIYNKDLQGPDVAATLPPQPSGRRSGPACWRPAIPSSSFRAATCMSSARRAGSASPTATATASGTATT